MHINTPPIEDHVREAEKVRATPTQERSTATLTNILDAADAVIELHGSLRMSTTLVAEYSECGISTVYRYFADRSAIFEALSIRHAGAFLSSCLPDISHRRHDTWYDAFAGVLGEFQSFFFDRPGFASVRFGDRFFSSPVVASAGMGFVSRQVSQTIRASFPELDAACLLTAVEESLLLSEGLFVRAHHFACSGDRAFADEALLIASAHLMRRYAGAAQQTHLQS